MRHLIVSGLGYYRGVHALVVAGVAVAVAVLAGALTVGASVRESLRELALARLGNTQFVVSSPAFVTSSLADRLGDSVPLVATTAAVVHAGTGRTAARVQVFGIDERFLRFHSLPGEAPHGREAWISEALATELNAGGGDELVLRVAKPSDIPLGTIQGRREDAGDRIRVTVTRVAGRTSLGEFSLAPAQGPALTMFVPLDRMQRDLGADGRVNALVIGGGSRDDHEIAQRLRSAAQLEDYGLRIRTSVAANVVVVESRAGVMSTPLSDAITSAAPALGTSADTVLVHLANVIRVREREIPYSLVAGTSRASGVALNDWAANDLSAKPGDLVELDYYVWSDDRGLETRHGEFTVDQVLPMSGDGADPTFMPDYPGLSDADDVSAWDPPFPVDLKRVRRVDEAYWDQWRGAPKVFVPLETAQRLWATPHGGVSSVRFTVPQGATLSSFAERVALAVRERLTPAAAGLQVRNARRDALAAAEGTTDFGEYFFYFSFFLVVSGLLLAALFFALGVEQRSREIGILRAIGFGHADVARVFVSEAAVLALTGALVGLLGAIAYAAIIMHGLRTWWVAAVGTTLLTLHLDWPLLAGGAAAALLAATGALALSLRTALTRTPRALLSGPPDAAAERDGRGRVSLLLAVTGVVLAGGLVVLATAGIIALVAAFFGAGGALMVAGLAIFNWWLRRPNQMRGSAALARFGADYARWRPTRSVLSVSLITFACFVIVSVGAFRREPSGLSLDRALGTGGFALIAESVVPLMHNPNTDAGREELGLPEDPLWDEARITRFRLKPGDEASCLSLYQPQNPRIIAPEPAFLDAGRFTFADSLAATAEERANPWLLLRRRFDDGAIAAIADQTSLTYVFHLAVGDDYVFVPEGGPSTRLRIVGALADSVLQSELIIGEDAFVTLFPRREGYGLWMIEARAADASALAATIEQRLGDFGVDVIDTRARLAAYHRVENTYLSTFQALGALGLLVGTLGLAAVLARNVLERRRELGLLRAIGFTPANMRTLVLSESMLLVGSGLVLGSATAAIAVLPALLERRGAVPLGGVAILLVAVTATAIVSSIAAARIATAVSVATAVKGE
jgi:putative ABC transport system permease protein